MPPKINQRNNSITPINILLFAFVAIVFYFEIWNSQTEQIDQPLHKTPKISSLEELLVTGSKASDVGTSYPRLAVSQNHLVPAHQAIKLPEDDTIVNKHENAVVSTKKSNVLHADTKLLSETENTSDPTANAKTRIPQLSRPKLLLISSGKSVTADVKGNLGTK